MGDKDTRRQLDEIFRGLSSQGQQALLDYAGYLREQYPVESTVDLSPQPIERPEDESVVLAIRRLSQTYPMLDRQALLHETSTFMMRHVMQGESAVSVIDDLEQYFERQYKNFCESKEQDGVA